MINLILTVWLYIALNQAEAQECFGVSVVRNGLNAFAAGEPRIGHFISPREYLTEGIIYIYKMCGDDTILPTGWK